jgi:hypothetical protein
MIGYGREHGMQLINRLLLLLLHCSDGRHDRADFFMNSARLTPTYQNED